MSTRATELLATSIAATLLCAAAAQADPVADFYRGRTVSISVGTAAGGGYDTYARVVANHLGRHIPGKPQVVVKNAPGAGGLVLANTLYNVASKDGTELATINRTLLLDPLLGNDKAQYDPRKYVWLGSPANETSTCIAYHTSGVRTVADLKQRELITGGPGTTTDSIMYPRLANATIGTKFKIITGFAGSADAILAMERGETQGFCGWSYSSMESIRPGWFKAKTIHVLLQFGLTRNPSFGDVPLVQELATTPQARQIVELIVTPQLFARPFMATPGMPAERASALQAAFETTCKDPAFVTEANERRLDVACVTGKEIVEALSKAYAAPREAVAEAKALLK